MTIYEIVEGMWWRPEPPPALLRWASHAYTRANAWNQRKRIREAVTPPIPLISVGNITVGGSGKTPFVIWLCRQLQQKKYSPVILCRGDGGRLKQPRLVKRGDAACEVGDEALLLARSGQAPVIAGRNRVTASIMAADLGDVLILDDGFQYRQLKRACDIVLIPAEGIGNGCLLPAGPLREPLTALSRADLVVRTGEAPVAPLSTAREWRWKVQSPGLRQIQGTATSTPEKVVAVCGIARPQRFLDSLVQQGTAVVNQMMFPDHYRYQGSDIEQIIGKGLPVVTTEKDAVKLTAIWPDHQPLWVLPIEGTGEEGLPDAIIQTMLSRKT